MAIQDVSSFLGKTAPSSGSIGRGMGGPKIPRTTKVKESLALAGVPKLGPIGPKLDGVKFSESVERRRKLDSVKLEKPRKKKGRKKADPKPRTKAKKALIPELKTAIKRAGLVNDRRTGQRFEPRKSKTPAPSYQADNDDDDDGELLPDLLKPPPLAPVGQSEGESSHGPITDPKDVGDMKTLLDLEMSTRAANLRRSGYDYAAIGKRLGIEPTQAFAIVKAEILRRREMQTEDLQVVRDIELARLDQLYLKAWSSIRAMPDPKMIEAALKIQARRAELLGLDAPKKHEINGEIAVEVKGKIEQLALVAARIIDDSKKLDRPFGSEYQIVNVLEDRKDLEALPEPMRSIDDVRSAIVDVTPEAPEAPTPPAFPEGVVGSHEEWNG